MIRNVFLLFMMVLIGGLGPAVAQDLFIKLNKDTSTEADSDEKPTLYNKPIVSDDVKKKQSAIKYKDRLDVTQLQNKSEIRIQTLDDWREHKLKPQNAEQLIAYADAHRAVAQNLMYKRRQALIEHLEKTERVISSNVSSNTAGAFKVGGNVSEDSGDETPEETGAERPRYFIKPKAESSKPTKVFTGYR